MLLERSREGFTNQCVPRPRSPVESDAAKNIGHRAAAAQKLSSLALLHCGHGQSRQIVVRFVDALRDRLLEPQTRFRRILTAGDASGEVAAEHQLGLTVAELCRGAEPALGTRAILG